MTGSRARKRAKVRKSLTCKHCERFFPHMTILEQHYYHVHPGLSAAHTAVVAQLPPKSLRYSSQNRGQPFATTHRLENHVQADQQDIKLDTEHGKESFALAKSGKKSSEETFHNCLKCSKRFEVEADLQNHTCGISKARLDSTGKPLLGSDAAVEAYINMIDMGFAVIPTPATDLLCGLEALAISLEAVRKLHGHESSPSVDNLKSTLDSVVYDILISDRLSFSPELQSTNNLTYEQLSVILQIKTMELGVEYRLGVTQSDATKTTLILLGEEGQTVWIHNSGGQYNDGEADKSMGHWSGYSNLSKAPR